MVLDDVAHFSQVLVDGLDRLAGSERRHNRGKVGDIRGKGVNNPLLANPLGRHLWVLHYLVEVGGQ